MSHSVPSDSSLVDRLLLFGPDLVAFDRPELPIYAAPKSLWAQAGSDAPLYGHSVDRLYGEIAEVHIETTPLIEEPREIAAAVDDPLVALPSLSDGLVLPACEHQSGFEPAHSAHTPGVEAVYDSFGDQHVHLQSPEGWQWDLTKPDWFFDHHV